MSADHHLAPGARKTTQLRQLLASRELEFILEAHNGISARIVDERERCITVVREPDPGTAKLDGDGDGGEDALDRCLQEREDLDGFVDNDGCPDVDDDGDGLSDVIDKCPREPEDLDGFEDLDGCPEAGP